MSELQKYISKRIRILRTQSGMTQEQLEEKADLGTNYAYKLENLEPNIKISTLEKIIEALNVDLQTFFDLTLYQSTNKIKSFQLLTQLLTRQNKKSGKG